jgi:hypothetical protein
LFVTPHVCLCYRADCTHLAGICILVARMHQHQRIWALAHPHSLPVVALNHIQQLEQDLWQLSGHMVTSRQKTSSAQAHCKHLLAPTPQQDEPPSKPFWQHVPHRTVETYRCTSRVDLVNNQPSLHSTLALKPPPSQQPLQTHPAPITVSTDLPLYRQGKPRAVGRTCCPQTHNATCGLRYHTLSVQCLCCVRVDSLCTGTSSGSPSSTVDASGPDCTTS